MPRTISFTKNHAIGACIVISAILAVTVSIGTGCAFAACAFIVLTA